MPWTPLYMIFGGMLAMTLLMLRQVAWWKCALVASLVGVGASVAVGRGYEFWPALYAPWVLGVLYGSSTGALVREERLTALLLFVSAALSSVPPLFYYEQFTNWQPPWTAADVLLITGIEAVHLLIFTWLTAALLLGLLWLLVAAPVNLLTSPAAAPHTNSGAREAINGWFADRFQIVFGILGIVSEVGSTRAEREAAKLRFGALASRRPGQGH